MVIGASGNQLPSHRRGGVSVARGGVSNFSTPPPLPGTPPLRGVGSRTSNGPAGLGGEPSEQREDHHATWLGEALSAISAISAGPKKIYFCGTKKNKSISAGLKSFSVGENYYSSFGFFSFFASITIW